MKNVNTGYIAIAVATMVVSIGIVGCDSANVKTLTDSATNTSEVLPLLEKELSLSASQVQVLQTTTSEIGTGRHPNMWNLAANLQETLNTGQKAILVERGSEAMSGMKERRQRDRRGNMHAGAYRNMRRLFARLNLTDEQAQSVQEMKNFTHAEIQKMSEDGAFSKEEKAAIRELRVSQHEAIKNILTEDQRVLVEETREVSGHARVLRKSASQRQRNEKKERRVKRSVYREQDAIEALNLTDDQIKQIKATRESAREEHMAFRKSDVETTELMEDRHELRLEIKSKLEAILTSDQKELRDLHRGLISIYSGRDRSYQTPSIENR